MQKIIFLINLYDGDHDQSYSSVVSSALAEAGTSSIHSYEVWSLSHWTIPSAVLSPLKSIGGWDLSLPKNLSVGNPWMSTPET